jgi:hypothetical protein
MYSRIISYLKYRKERRLAAAWAASLAVKTVLSGALSRAKSPPVPLLQSGEDGRKEVDRGVVDYSNNDRVIVIYSRMGCC